MTTSTTGANAARSAICEVARRLQLEHRTTASGVVNVVFKDTTSFTTLNTLHDAVKETAKRTDVAADDLLATQGNELLLAIRFGKKRARAAEPADGEVAAAVQKVGETLTKLQKSPGAEGITSDELGVARDVLEKLVGCLLGGDGEKVVQSFGVFAKKLATTDPRPRLVVAARLNASTPMRVAELKTALGKCWCDGAITTSDSLNEVSQIQLPLTSEGEASREFGNLPLLLVTSVPIQPTA
jgi:hypothetical protein